MEQPTEVGHASGTLRIWVGLFSLCLAGCGLAGDRVTGHLTRAEELLAADRGREAILELRAAAQLRPDDRDLTLRVAETAVRYGFSNEAAAYYTDAHELDPNDDVAALALAQLLIQGDPEQSAALVDDVLARDPKNARALLVRAKSYLSAGRVPEAMRTTLEARRLAPDDPEVYWVLAHVHDARIRAIRARGATAVRGRESLDPLLEAYRTYVEKGGEQRVQAALGSARAIGAWVGLEAEAREAYRKAITIAIDEGTLDEQIQVMRTARSYAHAVGDTDLERLALGHWIDAKPDAFRVWKMLSEVPDTEGKDIREATFSRMLEINPEHPSAHVVYAEYLAKTRGYGVAVDYLEQRIGHGMDDAVLLTGMVNIQHAHQRPLDAARTLERMQRDYGDRPATALLIARQYLTEKRIDEAVEILHDSLEKQETAEAQQLLARAELMRRHAEDALVAVNRAIELAGNRVPENIRLKARVQIALGENRKAATILRWLQRNERLTPDDQLMMARAYYDSNAAIFGRRILENMLAGKNPNPEAALELARREMGNRYRRDQIRAYLEAVSRRNPGHIEVLDALTRDDLANDRPRAALATVTKAILRRSLDGNLYLARARIMMAIGRPSDAMLDAHRALAVSPDVRNQAYEFLALVYLSVPNPNEAIEMLEQRDENGEATPDQIALLGRLYLHKGDKDRARALYERALAEGSDLTLLKNDLAYLLAESGQEFERALRLAREAESAPGEQLAAADTLGFVYLRSGNYEAAFWQFRFVTQQANPPVAEYYYHLGLALLELERHADARDALSKALVIEPGYAAATNALRRLDAASPDHSSPRTS